MYLSVHEPITAVAEFKHGHPEVKSFTWQARDYQVLKTTLRLKARKGRELVWLFCVTTATAAFKLRLDTDSLNWWLEEHTWEQSCT